MAKWRLDTPAQRKQGFVTERAPVGGVVPDAPHHVLVLEDQRGRTAAIKRKRQFVDEPDDVFDYDLSGRPYRFFEKAAR